MIKLLNPDTEELDSATDCYQSDSQNKRIETNAWDGLIKEASYNEGASLSLDDKTRRVAGESRGIPRL